MAGYRPEWESRVLLRRYLEQGLSKSAIARISPRTIYDQLATGQLDRDLDPATVIRYPRGRPSSILTTPRADPRLCASSGTRYRPTPSGMADSARAERASSPSNLCFPRSPTSPTCL